MEALVYCVIEAWCKLLWKEARRVFMCPNGPISHHHFSPFLIAFAPYLTALQVLCVAAGVTGRRLSSEAENIFKNPHEEPNACVDETANANDDGTECPSGEHCVVVHPLIVQPLEVQ